MTPSNFSALPLHPSMLKNLACLGYATMTPIQAHSLPRILAGKDVIAKARTGSGKTAAFGLGLLSTLAVELFEVQALVICPTRELSDQVSGELRRLARFTDNVRVLTLCGGVPTGPQMGSLRHGAHVVVGTPGRLLDHLRRGNLVLDRIKTLVLDEADRLLEMGFLKDITLLIEAAPRERQTLLFSATFPAAIAEMSATFQQQPVEISVDETHGEEDIVQVFFEIGHEERTGAVIRILEHYRPESTLVFCNTKVECKEVAEALSRQGFIAQALHGDLEQRDRDLVTARFSAKACSVLVATDVAARGLDIKELSAVINYELSPNPDIHIHRIGRTGRAGEQGLALSLLTPRDKGRSEAIDALFNAAVRRQSISTLHPTSKEPLRPPMALLCLEGGRKNKLRPGDVLGALTGTGTLSSDEVGKITVTDQRTWVAVTKGSAARALLSLSENKVKGHFFKVRRIG